jgi:hypothetical protein
MPGPAAALYPKSSIWMQANLANTSWYDNTIQPYHFVKKPQHRNNSTHCFLPGEFELE